MGLRLKAFAVVGAMLFLVTAVSSAVAAWVILAGADRAEAAESERNVARVREAIDSEIESLVVRANDWAAWDDCYRFVQGQNPGFVATNMPDQGWQEQQINGMVFLDTTGATVFSRFWNLGTNAPCPEPHGLAETLAPGKTANRHGDVGSRTSGMLLLEEGPLLIASLPIITSKRTGPIAGTLVLAKWLSASEVDEIQKRTKLTMVTTRAGESASTPGGASALAALSAPGAKPAFVTIADESRIDGYALLRDVDGKPALLLRVPMPRPLHAQAVTSLRAALGVFAGIAVLFCLGMFFFLDRLVVRPATRMSREVRELSESGDRSRRLAAGGSDEIGRLGASINEMLTRLQAAEQDLVRTRESALEAARVKARFLANISHELRTPLNGIIGLGRLALDTPLNPEQKEYLQAIWSSGQVLLALVNDILDLSKAESGKLIFEKSPFELRPLLEEILVPLRPRAEERGLKLEVVVEARVPPALVGDRLRLGQVLTNLVGNALKFTLQGSVRVEVSVGAPQGGKTPLHFAVVDTGVGIPAESQGRIFQAFSQADDTTARRFGGTGLGLTISQQIAEHMGGRIKVESREGHGSTFSFDAFIPVHTGTIVRTAEDTGRFPAVGRRLKVLLADDNPVNRLVGQRTLEKLGHSTSTVAGGEEAVQAAAKTSYDVILLDIQMPGVDGFEALRQIRTREAELAFRTPILALTAHAMPGAADASFRAGFDGHLVKPLEPSKLASALRRAVDKDMTTSVPPRRAATAPTGTAIVRGELLRHVGNDETLLVEIVLVFLKGADEAMRDIHTAAESGDLKKLEAHAHKINGSLRTLGARQAGLAADEVEKLAREGHRPEARASALRLLRLLEVAVQELKALTGEGGKRS